MRKVFAVALCASLILSFCLILSVEASEGTFGRTTEDATKGSFSAGYAGGNIFTLGEDASIYKISIYCNSTNAAGSIAKTFIYTVSGGQPSAKVAESSNVTVPGSGMAWCNFTITAELTAGDYFLGLIPASDGIVAGRTASGTCHYKSTTYNSLPDPFGTHSDSSYTYDIFAYYTTEDTTYTVDLTIDDPENTTYETTVPVSLSNIGNDTAPTYSWNVLFQNSSWLYASNKTVTTYSMTIAENQTDCLFACKILSVNGTADYDEVYFSVVYYVADAWDADLNNYFCAAILLVMGFVFMVFMVSRRVR